MPWNSRCIVARVLDVDRQQEHTRTGLEDGALHAVAAVHLALVELRNPLLERGERGLGHVGVTLDAQRMLLNLTAATLDEVGIERVAKQIRMVPIEPEGAVQIALAGRQFVHDIVVLECDLEDRLLPG